jgi:putative ABC transport system permease protein
MDGLMQDVRFAVRLAIRKPGFVIAAALTLAIGIGANTSMFGVVHTVLFGDLRFPDPDRTLRLRDGQTDPTGLTHSVNISSRHAIAIRELNSAFDGVIALAPENLTLSDGPRPERLSVVSRTDGWEETLSVAPILGRSFTSVEMAHGSESGVCQVSYGLWQGHFAGDPGVLGRSLHIGNGRCSIVGVLPRGFRFPYDADVWLPLRLDPGDTLHDFAVFAHLRSGVQLGAARADLSRVASRVRELYADTPPGYTITTMTLRENLTDNREGAMVAVAYMIGFLLALASLNVANLLLVRAVIRRKEFAVRRALGASRARQLRQLLTESVLLGCLGCAAGVMLSLWFSRAAGLLVPSNISDQLGLAGAQLDARMLGFACLLSLVVGVVSGIVPAVSASRTDLQRTLAEGGRSEGAGPKGRALLGALVVSEVAVAFVLLAGAGMMMENFARLRRRALGFEPRQLLTVKITPPWNDYPTAEKRQALVRGVLAEVERLPGVASLAATTVNPLGGGSWTAPVVVEGLNTSPTAEPFNVNHRLITPGLFGAMGIPLLRGRHFTSEDTSGSEPVAIVSAQMAARFWPREDPIGKRVRVARGDSPWLRVVGVVGDVRDARDPEDPAETWYLPFAQQAGTRATENVYLMAHIAGRPAGLVASIEQAVWKLDKALVPYEISMMDSYYSDSLVRERLGAGFMAFLGGFGLLVAGLGVYGVMAFTTAERAKEVGLRMALGARAPDILLMILANGMRLTITGLGIGLAGALCLNRVLANRLAEVRTLEWSVTLSAFAIFFVAAAIGSLLPARRAARLQPMTALRHD